MSELVVHNQSGITVRPKEPVVLAAAIRQLVDDPSLRQSLGQRAHERINTHFNIESTITETIALYEELMKNG